MFVLNDGSRKVEFRHFGWAHTRGDGFVYLPKDQVLCTGDAAVNGPYNFTADANVGNWPKVIRYAQALGATYVLPGHGPAGGPEILEGPGPLHERTLQVVDSAIKSGKRLEDVVPRARQRRRSRFPTA